MVSNSSTYQALQTPQTCSKGKKTNGYELLQFQQSFNDNILRELQQGVLLTNWEKFKQKVLIKCSFLWSQWYYLLGSLNSPVQFKREKKKKTVASCIRNHTTMWLIKLVGSSISFLTHMPLNLLRFVRLNIPQPFKINAPMVPHQSVQEFLSKGQLKY